MSFLLCFKVCTLEKLDQLREEDIAWICTEKEFYQIGQLVTGEVLLLEWLPLRVGRVKGHGAVCETHFSANLRLGPLVSPVSPFDDTPFDRTHLRALLLYLPRFLICSLTGKAGFIPLYVA